MNEGVSSPLIGVDAVGSQFVDRDQCQTESDDDKSSGDKNSENILSENCLKTSEEDLEDELWLQIKSVQLDTLSLQRKFSSELKIEKSGNNTPSKSPPSTPLSKTRRLLRQAKPTVAAPKNKIEKQVVDFKNQLLTIEGLLNEPKPENYSTREEIKLKIKSRFKVSPAATDQMDPAVEIRPRPPRPKKTPPPPPPQQQQQQTDVIIAPKIVITKQSDSSTSSPLNTRRPSSFGIQWKRVQNSKSVKFLTDTSPIRRNFRGFKKAFKSSEEVVTNNNNNSESHRLSDFSLMEEEEVEEEEDLMGTKILKRLNLENSKINREYLSELVDVLAEPIDEASSGESDDEEEVISEMALREIATFEKLIEAYKREIS